MFGKKEVKKQGTSIPFVIFRLLLSLTMFLILSFGLYSAFRYFSGVDPVRMDPQTLILSLVTSSDLPGTVQNILGVSVAKNLTRLMPAKQAPLPIPDNTPSVARPTTAIKRGGPILKFALVADSHNDNENLAKALSLAKDSGAKFIIGLGDWTDVGTKEELKSAKQVFLDSGLPFYVTAGDHDLWNGRDKDQNPLIFFEAVFGSSYQSLADSNIRFILLDNSDNYDGVGPVQMHWLKDELKSSLTEHPKAIFVFMHEPLSHPTSDHFMGRVTPSLLEQAGQIASLLKEAKVSQVFYGDTHSFTRYQDSKSGLSMTTVGAVGRDRNPEGARFAIVTVFEDGSFDIENKEI